MEDTHSVSAYFKHYTCLPIVGIYLKVNMTARTLSKNIYCTTTVMFVAVVIMLWANIDI